VVLLGALALFGVIDFSLRPNNPGSILTMGLQYGSGEQSYYLKSIIAVVFGFLGAYIFSLSTLIRRYVMFDLQPRAYYAIVQRIIFSCSVALAIRFVAESWMSPKEGHMLPALFFLVGMVPESGFTFLQDIFKSKLRSRDQSMEPQLSIIDGVSIFQQLRLQEEGIDTLQNLVTCDPVELALKTHFDLSRIEDWASQAQLYLHFPGNIERLRKVGLRTARDFVAVNKKGYMPKLAEELKIDTELLSAIAEVMEQTEIPARQAPKAAEQILGYKPV